MEYAFMVWGAIFLGGIAISMVILTKSNGKASAKKEWEFEEKYLKD